MMTKLFNLLHWLRKWYWRTFKIKTFGVRVIIKKENKFFLVKHRYGNLWVLPGGGMKKNESLEDVGRREVREETNIDIISFERTLGTYHNTQESKDDTVTILIAKEWKDLGRKWNWEIKKSDFFDPGNLPKATSFATRRRIKEYLSGEEKQFLGKW